MAGKLRKKNRKVFGVGINDADYCIRTLEDGKRIMCPFYRVWSNMLQRCYHIKFLDNNLTYEDKEVCEEWHLFSNFKAWMEKQDWKGKCLDKDLLLQGNKIYSPETCIFITQTLNNLLGDREAARKDCPIGTLWHSRNQNWNANIGIMSARKYLGVFNCKFKAHKAWQYAKIEAIQSAISEVTDNRLSESLGLRVAQLQHDIDNGLETKKL